MRILIYHCPDAPSADLAYIGHIWLPAGDPARVHPKEALFGVRFNGASAEETRAKVNSFWNEHLNKALAKAEARKVLAAKRAPVAAADPGPPEELV